MKWNQSRPGFELESPCSFPTTITTTPRAPKQSDGEVPVMLEFWGMQNTPSLPLLPGPLWPGMVAPDRDLSIGQIKQTVCKQMTDVKL